MFYISLFLGRENLVEKALQINRDANKIWNPYIKATLFFPSFC